MEFSYKKDAAYCATVPLVLKVEGGYVNDPSDKGGPTMYGVAWNYNADAMKSYGITRNTVMNLTKDQALQIYYERYWLASDADGITDEGLAYIHFDAAVNCGVGQAKIFLSKLSKNPKDFDGRGDNNEVLFLRLVHEYEILRSDFYTTGIKSKEQKQRYLEGWINRMEVVNKHAFALV